VLPGAMTAATERRLFVLELDTESHAAELTDSPHRRAYPLIGSVEVSTGALIRRRHQALDPLMQHHFDAVRSGQSQTLPIDNPRGPLIWMWVPFSLSFAQYPKSMIGVSKQSLPDIHDLPFGVTEVAPNRPKMASELIYRWLLAKVTQILQIPNDKRRVERMKPIEVAASPVRNLAILVKHELPERLRLHGDYVVTTASSDAVVGRFCCSIKPAATAELRTVDVRVPDPADDWDTEVHRRDPSSDLSWPGNPRVKCDHFRVYVIRGSYRGC
jgi:hypothetical protein